MSTNHKTVFVKRLRGCIRGWMIRILDDWNITPCLLFVIARLVRAIHVQEEMDYTHLCPRGYKTRNDALGVIV